MYAHVHRDDLMKPDMLSEAVLLGFGLLIVVAFILMIAAACAN